MAQDREAWIAARAHEIWQSEGGPHGRHEEHWRRAVDDYGRNESTAAQNAVTAGDFASANGSTPRDAKADKTGSTPLETVETAQRVEKARR